MFLSVLLKYFYCCGGVVIEVYYQLDQVPQGNWCRAGNDEKVYTIEHRHTHQEGRKISDDLTQRLAADSLRPPTRRRPEGNRRWRAVHLCKSDRTFRSPVSCRNDDVKCIQKCHIYGLF